MKIGTIIKYSENCIANTNYKEESETEFKELEELDRNSRMMIIYDDGNKIIARNIHLDINGEIQFGCYYSGLTHDDITEVNCTNEELLNHLRQFV